MSPRRNALRLTAYPAMRFGLVLLLVLSAGCTGIFGSQDTPTDTETPTAGAQGFIVSVAIVETPPDGAHVTNYNDSELQGDTTVKRLVREAYEAEQIRRDITGQEYDTIESELADVSRYDGGEFGYYIEYRGEVIRVRTLVEE